MSLIYGYNNDEKGTTGSGEQVKQVEANKESIEDIKEFIGDAGSSLEGESDLKGIQLSHASAIMTHSNNLLELEDLLGTKTDDETDDTAFGRIKKNINNVSIKETTGKFIAPFNAGNVEITGWSMPDKNTVIAVFIKSNNRLSGVSRVTIYSSDIFFNSKHAMTSPMYLNDMKKGKGAIMFMGRNPSHSKMFASTIGNAVGSVAVRTVSVRFVYIDHSGA